MKQKRVHWGIIGCGAVTEVKSGPAFYRLPHTALVGVMRRNKTLAQEYAQRHNVPMATNDAQVLIQHPDVKAIYIATPPSSHALYALSALRQGKPVYVEKPMATTSAECRAMITAATQHHTPLFVAYYRRHMPYFKEVKRIIDSGVLGEIRTIETRLIRTPSPADTAPDRPWRLDKKISGGGYFVDMGSHQIDLYIHLFGTIDGVEEVTAENRGGLYDLEDYVKATFRFSSGAMAHGIWDFAAQPAEVADYTEVHGSRATLRFSCFTMEPIALGQAGEVTHFSYPRLITVEEPMIDYITHAILDGTGRSAENLAALDDACRVTELMEAILS